jgi:glutamine amidotransferase-like uncharacterized protein
MLLFLALSMSFNFGMSYATNSSSSTNQNIQSSNTSTSNSSIKTASNTVKTVSTNPTKTIRVLIYNGNGAITSCVNGIKTALTSANNNNLVPGYYFTYATSTSITSSVLANYDLLAMPGGDSGKAYLSYVSQSAVRNFVSSGHGFLGICAGAYASSYYVGGSGVSYYGWGVAPHVSSKVYNHEGNLQVTMTTSASQLLGSSGTTTIVHYNGPAMYGSGFTRFASYSSGTYSGYAAIVGDTYGNGRSVLSGPHPELDPQNPTLIAKMIIWATNVTPTTTSKTFTMSQISTAAKTVKTYVDSNNKLPSYVTISGTQITMAQFLNLVTSDLLNVNRASTSAITLKTVSTPVKTSTSVTAGNILKTEYLKLATNINSYFNTNNRAPSYVSSSLGKISLGSAVYLYSKIMVYYAANNRLPSYVSVKNWSF